MHGNSSLELFILLQRAEEFLGSIDKLHSDGWDGYKKVAQWIKHRYVNRSKEEFVSKDRVHINDLECIWNMIRRWLETERLWS